MAPGSDGSAPEAGRRRADARADDAATRRPDGPLEGRSTGVFQRPPREEPDEASMTMPRQSRADRRRDGLLPAGDDPMRRREALPPAGDDALRRRPAGRAAAPPPESGRRRTDLDAGPAGRPAVGDRPPAPRPTPPISGPMTSAAPGPTAPRVNAAPATSITGRPTPPPAARRPADQSPRVGPASPPPARPSPAPKTTGMPDWAAEPSTPAPLAHDMTQRVSGAVPADSAWGSPVAAAPVVHSAPQPVSRPSQPPAAQVPARPARPAAGRGGPAAPVVDLGEDVPEAAAGPSRRRVDIPVGGRAALRLERQATEAARKKSGGRRSGPDSAPPPRAPGSDDDPAERGGRRTSRRVVQGLMAVVVVALAVLGVWSFTSPDTTETSAQTPAPSSAPVAAPPTPVQETLVPSPEIVATPVGPVFAPITVLNSTRITGLAATIGEQFTGGGWEVVGTGQSPVSDVATTTVYYSEGNTVQQQAATQLVEQYPDVSGPVARYFEVPDVADPGLVVVATGNWQP